ncbi:helix-turn-helix transcriptional regulator [Paenibacillus sp. GP183]|uniref:helix-turn-helix domain-containing protein n=1 Tax=Paenibacillus sp. GP183 TaxID=1882751 RepID=UPI001495E25F|nr:helix-turn-helix transcriptional regulator [Paenibacillus sp. GP183]
MPNLIGVRIKYIRKLHKLNQINFSESIGISQGNLSEIESGKILPSLETVIKLGQQYNLDLNWLINNTAKNVSTQLLEDEDKLIYLYRQLQSTAKEEVIDFLELKGKRYTKS